MSIRKAGAVIAEAAGDYGGGEFRLSGTKPAARDGVGLFPVIGSWIVDGEPAGMGIREDRVITGNASRFMPHVIEG